MDTVYRLFVLCFTLLASASPVFCQWQNAPIGGGGRTVGFIDNPSTGEVYLRTDVAGFYKRTSESNNTWRRLTQSLTPDYGNGESGAAGLGLHPTNRNILYVALSKGVYKTTDGGNSWNRVLTTRIYPNGDPNDREDRNYGESLVVDRYNGNVIYYGSQRDGLFYSRNGGSSWIQLSSNDFPRDGSRCIVVDNTRSKIDVGTWRERAKNVYVSVKGKGIYRSTNGGNSFGHWVTELPGGGNYVRWLRLAKDGNLYAAYERGLARWDGTSWRNISPNGANEVTAVATHPSDARKLLAASDGKIYRTSNYGNTWTTLSANQLKVGDQPPWAVAQNYKPGSPVTFSLYIDNASRAYINSNYFPWTATNPWGNSITWDAIYEGNEMTINISGVSLPGDGGAAYIAGMADIRGFRYVNPAQMPTERIRINQNNLYFTPNFTGMDFCQSKPRVVWFVASKVPNYDCTIYKSTDGGSTLTYINSPVAGANDGGPKIAVSSTDENNVVVMIRDRVYYTKNGGGSWNLSTGLDDAGTLLARDKEYEFDQLLKSDRVNGSKFYIYSPSNGNFYKSTNGGQSFSKVPGAGLPRRTFGPGRGIDSGGGGGVHMALAPGREELVWLALGASGIWKASASGTNKTDKFNRVNYFSNINPTAVSWGRFNPQSSDKTAALYVYGRRASDNKWGIFRSMDLGSSWNKITPDNDPGQWPRVLVGDFRTFGRVYVSDASRGVRYFTNTNVNSATAMTTIGEEPGTSPLGLGLYPNPTQGELNLTQVEHNTPYTIHSMERGLVQEGVLSSVAGQATVDVSQLPNGLYTIRTAGKTVRFFIR